MSPSCFDYSPKEAELIVPVLAVLARLPQLSSEFFIKRRAYTKVMGIHNIQILDLKNSGSRGSIKDFH